MATRTAWARATVLGALTSPGIGALDRAAVLLETLSAQLPSLPWLVLGLAAAAAVAGAGFVVYAVLVVAGGLAVFVIAETAAIVAGLVVALWCLGGLATLVVVVYLWTLAGVTAWRLARLGAHLAVLFVTGNDTAFRDDTKADAPGTAATAPKPGSPWPSNDPYLTDVPHEDDDTAGAPAVGTDAPRSSAVHHPPAAS